MVEVEKRTIFNEHYLISISTFHFYFSFLLTIFTLHFYSSFLLTIYTPHFLTMYFEHHSSPFLNLDNQSTFEMVIFFS
jgi:hypothetical protein